MISRLVYSNLAAACFVCCYISSAHFSLNSSSRAACISRKSCCPLSGSSCYACSSVIYCYCSIANCCCWAWSLAAFARYSYTWSEWFWVGCFFFFLDAIALRWELAFEGKMLWAWFWGLSCPPILFKISPTVWLACLGFFLLGTELDCCSFDLFDPLELTDEYWTFWPNGAFYDYIWSELPLAFWNMFDGSFCYLWPPIWFRFFGYSALTEFCLGKFIGDASLLWLPNCWDAVGFWTIWVFRLFCYMSIYWEWLGDWPVA